MNRPLRVVWICNVMNPEIINRLKFKMSFANYFVRMIQGKNIDLRKEIKEVSPWITNGINELKLYQDEVELHIISPCPYLKNKKQEFIIDGTHYHFYRNEIFTMSYKVKCKLRQGLLQAYEYLGNRNLIKEYIVAIKPNIIQLIGAENPFYSLSALDVPQNIPLIVQLQTLMNEPGFEANFPISHSSYVFRAKSELQILRRADYIGCSVNRYVNHIKNNLIPNSIILRTRLAVGVNRQDRLDIKKEFTFVYFSKYIDKAVDLAIEAFALAQLKIPFITLLIIGGYTVTFKRNIDQRIEELGMGNSIFFTGELPTHADVLSEIQKARFALLPLKVDVTSGTIREAMACGLPVLTTITQDGTPHLNDARETVLLSPIGDHQALANNMIRICHSEKLSCKLRENGFMTVEEKYSNKRAILDTIAVIKATVNHFYNGSTIPDYLLSKTGD